MFAAIHEGFRSTKTSDIERNNDNDGKPNSTMTSDDFNENLYRYFLLILFTYVAKFFNLRFMH